jgi:hypothetical protein
LGRALLSPFFRLSCTRVVSGKPQALRDNEAQESEEHLVLNVVLSRRGKMFSKAFYDRTHGGSSKALEAALAWRGAMMAKTGLEHARVPCAEALKQP